MEPSTRIVIMEIQDYVRVGNATWCCFSPPGEMPDELFKIQGHKVVRLPKSEAEELLKRMVQATALQVNLRELFYAKERN